MQDAKTCERFTAAPIKQGLLPGDEDLARSGLVLRMFAPSISILLRSRAGPVGCLWLGELPPPPASLLQQMPFRWSTQVFDTFADEW